MSEPILYECMGLSPPLNLNLVQDSVAREAPYGCRRFSKKEQGYDKLRQRLTWHQGIDLVSDAPEDGREVYAVNWGIVEDVIHSFDDDHDPDHTLVLRHEPLSSGYYSQYRHLEKTEVAIGTDVISGQLLGRFSAKKAHLHYELRRLFDSTEAALTNDPINTISLDPTPFMYRFEADGWPRERDEEIERHWHRDYRRIDRLRVMPWTTRHEVDQHAAWLFEISREGSRSDYYYLPVGVGTPRENLMIEVLRDAFKARAAVRLHWRVSHFFGERAMIEDVRVKYAD